MNIARGPRTVLLTTISSAEETSSSISGPIGAAIPFIGDGYTHFLPSSRVRNFSGPSCKSSSKLFGMTAF